MRVILRNWRVLAAMAFSVVLVVGAYELARGVGNPPVAQASAETALLQQIASKDSTGDGLPDWQKALYGIPLDATTSDYFHLGMTDGQAVAQGLIVPKAVADLPTAGATTSAATDTPISVDGVPAPGDGTLTDAFSKDFITLYLDAKAQNNDNPLSPDQLNTVSQQALSDLAQSVSLAPDFKSASDLTVSGSGNDAMVAYANVAGAVLAQRSSGATKSEISYLQDAVQNNDAQALTTIGGIAKDYRTAAVGLAALPVPQELAPSDLALINAFARLSGIVQDFTSVNSDPLSAMLALQQYPDAVLALGNALIAVHNAYQTASITLPLGSPAEAFVDAIPDIAAEQASSTQP